MADTKTQDAPAKADGEDVVPAEAVDGTSLPGEAVAAGATTTALPKVGQVIAYRPTDDDRRSIAAISAASAGRVNELEDDGAHVAVLVTGVRPDQRPAGHPADQPGFDLVTGVGFLDGSRADATAATFPVRIIAGSGSEPGQWAAV